MKYALSLALGLALCAGSAATQISGSINRNAPTVSNSISFNDHSKLEVTYTAIHFGEGRWQSIVGNEGRHERFNSLAARKPIGNVTTTKLVMASGREIAAGEYSLYFTVSKRAGGFVLNLQNKGDKESEPIRWRLALSDTDAENKRLQITLAAASAADEASLTIAFGKKSVTVPLTAKKAEAKDSNAKKADKGQTSEKTDAR